MLNQDTPTAVDFDGSRYTFEKGAEKNSGGDGFADVWKRGYFGWEYKRKHESLGKAYQQLLKYREALENPPLLVVCDLERFEVHTNWTNTSPEVYEFCLQDLLGNQPIPTCKLPPLEVLTALFTDPGRLKPGETAAQVTTQAAVEFGNLAMSLRTRGVPAERAAHYIMRLLFCLFAEDVGLLPDRLFTRLIKANRSKPADFVTKLRRLFHAMSKGGSFGADDILYFDGGLFLDNQAYELTADDLSILARVAALNWAAIEPAIFGTLFERILDPEKRSQIGAHYTHKEDILLIIEPVLMAPLRKQWVTVQEQANELLNGKKKAAVIQKELSNLLSGFAATVASIRVFDPACGSGNFLYLALKRLLDLEKEISVFASTIGLSRFFIRCRPTQLYGIEKNIYAHEVASVAVWIGFLQWQRDNGIIITDIPIMQPLENIRCSDALLEYDGKGNAIEPEWSEADVIIGNPPFLGGKKLKTELGEKYVDDLFEVYSERVPHEADLVCYWFEKSREQISKRKTKRAGLLATQGIRGGANRTVLERIKQSGDIFWAQSEREWILEGANVHVSMIGFDDGSESYRWLNDQPAATINSNLSSLVDLTCARRLKENGGIAFMGTTRIGPFEITAEQAAVMRAAPLNPNGRPNSDVVRPWTNGKDVTSRPRGMWIIDFGVDMSEAEAALYEMPFEHVKKYVKPEREKNNRASYAQRWWIYGEPRPAMRSALENLSRYIATPLVSKHRIFTWLPVEVLPENLLTAIAREDDYFFGVLHSRSHELWALRMGTALEDRPRYTATTTFETYPFPWTPGSEPQGDPRKEKIATAARDLTKKRDLWLNPPGVSDEELSNRTLTKLYNENPTWLRDSHRELDQVVLDAYGWNKNLSDNELLASLLSLNAERYAKEQDQGALDFEPKRVPRKTVVAARRARREKDDQVI